MQPGDMRDPITIERMRLAPDGAGGQTEDWVVLHQVWARVRRDREAEAMAEGRMVATATAVFTIYALDDLDERDRVIWNGVAWNIRGLPPSPDVLFRSILAERGVGS